MVVVFEIKIIVDAILFCKATKVSLSIFFHSPHCQVKCTSWVLEIQGGIGN
jgi:hypothetical protein